MEYNEIIKLIQTVSESNIDSFSIEQGDFKLSLKNKENVNNSEIQSSNIDSFIYKGGQIFTDKVKDTCQYIESPLVGIFYTSSSENSDPFISVGDEIKKGQVIGIIEAMKLMNEVTSSVNGIVEEILVDNEQTVEYGQAIVRVRPL